MGAERIIADDFEQYRGNMGMSRSRVTALFIAVLTVWVGFALVVSVVSSRWVALASLPAALLLFVAARSERLSQSAQLVWPILLLPGATFAMVGFMQAMGYGRMETEPQAAHLVLRATFFACGLLLHLAAFLLLATESRALDHPGGEIAEQMP